MLVSAVEIRSCLLVVEDVEDLAEPIEELGLAAVGSSIDQDAVGLALSVKDQVLDYVFDKVIMLSALKQLF